MQPTASHSLLLRWCMLKHRDTSPCCEECKQTILCSCAEISDVRLEGITSSTKPGGWLCEAVQGRALRARPSFAKVPLPWSSDWLELLFDVQPRKRFSPPPRGKTELEPPEPQEEHRPSATSLGKQARARRNHFSKPDVLRISRHPSASRRTATVQRPLH